MLKYRTKSTIIVSVLCLTVLFATSYVPSALAEDIIVSDQAMEKQILSSDCGINQITDLEIEYLKNHPKLMMQRIQKDLQYFKEYSNEQHKKIYGRII